MFEPVDEPQAAQLREAPGRCVCYGHEPAMFDRPELWIPVILGMFAGFFFPFVLFDFPFGIQLGSIVPYTLFVALGTFSAQRGSQPFFFNCPVVRQTMPRLLRRHGYFLAGVVIFQTIALHLTRYMPASWLRAGKNGSPFALTLGISCICAASVQVWTNRTLLEQAHEQSGYSTKPSSACE